MHTQANKTQENRSQSVANAVARKKSGGKSTLQFADNRPEAIAQRELQEMANNSPQVKQLNARQEMIKGSRLQPSLQYSRVIQAEKKTVAGVEVDIGGGYTNWEGWHINWRLGSKKGGHEQYHLTSQDRTQHYFFIIDGDTLEDTKPPAKLTPKKKKGHIVGGLSDAPPGVQDFVRTNFRKLM